MSDLHAVPVLVEDVALQPHMGELITSLPVSLVASDTKAGAVVALAGQGDWPARAVAALAEGAVGLVVNDPDPVPVENLDPLRLASQPVLLDRPFLSNPALDPSRARWHSCAAQTLMLDSTLFASTGSDVYAELFRHLCLVRAVTGPLVAARLLSVDDLRYTATAKLPSEASALLTGVLTDAALPRAEVRLLGSPHRLSMTIYPSATARAATVSVVDADGEVVLPTLYENGHRATWRRMLAHLANGRLCGDLDDFASDVATFDLLPRAEVA